MSRYSERQKKKIHETSKKVRAQRKIHRYIGIIVLLFLLLSATTGIILSWKKDIAILQPPSTSFDTNISLWLPNEELLRRAIVEMDRLHPGVSGEGIDRMDIRPEKGIVKILFNKGYWEVQLNCETGEILSVDKRYSDLFEQIHDGSIIGDTFKLASMNLLGISIIIMTITGFWLWFGPRRIKKIKSRDKIYMLSKK